MHRISLLVLLIFCIQFTQSQVNSEYYNYTQYGSESGLPHSLVFDIKQSSDGYIWVATNNGLGRFDGYNFKTFRPQVNSNSNISGKSISELFFDNSKNLWLVMQGIGLDKMNLNSEHFTTFNPNIKDSTSISGNNIISILPDPENDSNLWVGTNKGLDYFDSKLNHFIKCKSKEGIKVFNYVKRITSDFNNQIWFLSDEGIFCCNSKDKTITSLFEMSGGQNWIKSLNINSIVIEDKRKIWIGTYHNGLFCFNLETKTIEYELPEFEAVNYIYLNKKGDLFFATMAPNNTIYVIPKQTSKTRKYQTVYTFSDASFNKYINYIEDAMGNIWITLADGLFKVYPDYTISRIKSKGYDANDLLKENINGHCIDSLGNLWLSAERKGVVMIDLNQKQFSQYKHLREENKIISGDNISMVFTDSKGKLWIGCYAEGITCYDPKTKQYKTIAYNSAKPSMAIYKAPAGIAEDANGDIWIGFYDGGLSRINPATMKIEYFSDDNPKNKNYFRGIGIRSIITDNNKNVWFATSSTGLVELESKTGKYIYHSELYEPNFTLNSLYRFICQTHDGLFWSGSQNGGLGKYNVFTHEFLHFRNDTKNSNSINGNTVYYVYEQSDSILWVGTDKGLNKFNRNTQKFTSIALESDGYSCAIYRIYPDKNNNLWLSGDCGVVKFNTTNNLSTKYTKADGLPATEFNTTAGCQTNSGEIFLGTSNGLVSFYPDNIKPNPYLSKPILTNLKIFNKIVSVGDTILGDVILDKKISLLKEITLPYSLNDFTLEFSAMHFSAPEKNQYRYKLTGFNDQWIKTESSRRWANYTGLRPGTYTFYLESTNNDGVICNESDKVQMTIVILPPFTETLWFRMILIAVLGLTILLIFRLRIRIIKRQKIALEKLVKERTIQLNDTNSRLEERHEEIEVQNEELERHRNNLEELVEMRTIQLKKALLIAEETDRLKSAFLANMSHEIRTPMNAILGFSALLRDDFITTEEKNIYAEIIVDNGEALLDLLNDILDRSIIESGQLKINKREVDANKLLSDVLMMFSKHKIVVENPELNLVCENNLKEPFFIFTDPLRLTQILNNLIGNALKFTPKGTITISYATTNDTVSFKIADTGLGMEEPAIDFIFDRFHKIENPNTTFYRGAGLGLSICQSLVEMLGGEIWAQSKLGIGSSFYFTILAK